MSWHRCDSSGGRCRACPRESPQLPIQVESTSAQIFTTSFINFHEGNVASLDDNNMVKPIRDAMNKLIYVDDSRICYSETIHVSIDAAIKLRRASSILLAAFSKGEEFLSIRIDDAPDVIQLPQ
jgi:hypothetical protein